ncbi:MAG: TolC family protein [Deltaproteobacteria bacterium]|nr:TolC family protein [Deltaproteobacteria bacterium]
MKRRALPAWLIGIAALLAGAIPAAASTDKQADPLVEPLTLESCVRLALQRNPSLAAARSAVTASVEGVGEARAPYLPEISLNAGYGRWERHAFLPAGVSRSGMSTEIGPTDDWSAGLRARLALFDSGRRRARVGTAVAREGAASANLSRARQDLILEAQAAYFGVLAAKEVLGVAEESVRRAQDHRHLAEERLKEGAVPRADVVHAEVEVADARLARVRAENLVRVASGRLATVLGLSPDANLEVARRNWVATAPETVDLDRALEQAVSSRPALGAARKRVEATRQTVDLARSTFGPRVVADAGYGWRDDRFRPRDEDWSVGVAVEVPLFSGLSSVHGLARARAEQAREEAEVERLALAVRQEVWTSHSRLRESYEALGVSGALVAQAQENLRLARGRYEAGAGTLTELLDAEAALTRAEASRTGARWDHQVAIATFRWAAGGLAEEGLAFGQGPRQGAGRLAVP